MAFCARLLIPMFFRDGCGGSGRKDVELLHVVLAVLAVAAAFMGAEVLGGIVTVGRWISGQCQQGKDRR